MKLCTSMYIIVYIYIDMKSTSRILIYACICIDVFACISYHLWQIVIWTDALAMNISSKTPRFLRYIQNHKVIQRPHSPNIYIYTQCWKCTKYSISKITKNANIQDYDGTSNTKSHLFSKTKPATKNDKQTLQLQACFK